MNNALILLNAAKPVFPQDDWGLVFSTVLTGLVIVFLILIILIIFIEIMGRVNSGSSGKRQKPRENSLDYDMPYNPPARFEQTEINTPADDVEIIAVISAAISALGESCGKTYAVKSIRKRENPPRSSWANAGISETTRPFSR